VLDAADGERQRGGARRIYVSSRSKGSAVLATAASAATDQVLTILILG